MPVLNQDFFCSQEAQDAFVLERLVAMRAYLRKLLKKTPGLYPEYEDIMQDVAVKFMKVLPTLKVELGLGRARSLMNIAGAGVVSKYQEKYIRRLHIRPFLSLDETLEILEGEALVDLVAGPDLVLVPSHPDDSEREKALRVALYRLPLSEQEELKRHYQLADFEPCPPATQYKLKATRGSAAMLKRALHQLRKDPLLQQALSA